MTAGFAIYDTMQHVKPDVSTLCVGQAASFAAVLLAGGAEEKRMVLPNARVLIHQPWVQSLGGQQTDIDIHAQDLLRMRGRIDELLAQHTGKSIEEVHADNRAGQDPHRGNGGRVRACRPRRRAPRGLLTEARQSFGGGPRSPGRASIRRCARPLERVRTGLTRREKPSRNDQSWRRRTVATTR